MFEVYVNVFHSFFPRCCSCNCQNEQKLKKQKNLLLTNNAKLITAQKLNNNNNNDIKLDAACQTLSTGDIVITKIFFKEDQEKGPERVIISSPKKVAQ